jgi:hypothetical protein
LGLLGLGLGFTLLAAGGLTQASEEVLLTLVPGICERLRHLVGIAVVANVDKPGLVLGLFVFGGILRSQALFVEKSGLVGLVHNGSLLRGLELGIEVTEERAEAGDRGDTGERFLGSDGPVPGGGTQFRKDSGGTDLHEVVEEELDRGRGG